MKRKLTAALLLLFATMLLAGCSGRIDINELAIVTAVGLDKGNQPNTVKVTAVFIVRRTPGINFIDQVEVLVGKWGGKIVGLILFLFFVGAFGGSMITYVYHLKDYFLPDAPVALLIIVALLVGLYSNYHGLEVIGRLALVGMFSVFSLNYLLMIGSIGDFDMKQFLPVFESGVWNTVWASRHNDTDWAVGSLMAAIILPMVKEKERWGKSSAAGIIMGWVAILMFSILETGVMSSEVAGQYVVACMQMARSAELGNFVRYEMIMIALFAIPLFVQISVCLFCASHVTAQIFGLKSHKPTLIPVSLLLGGFGYWVVLDHIRAMDLLSQYWPPIALTISYGLPIMLVVLGFLFRKKLKQAMQKMPATQKGDGLE